VLGETHGIVRGQQIFNLCDNHLCAPFDYRSCKEELSSHQYANSVPDPLQVCSLVYAASLHGANRSAPYD